MPKNHKRKTPKAKPSTAHATPLTSFTLPAVLDMRAVASLKAALVALYEQRQPCVLLAGGVTRMSAGGAQTLASFMQAMTRAKIKVKLRDPSAAFLNALGKLDFEGMFDEAISE